MKEEEVSWMRCRARSIPHFLYNTLDSITWMVEGGRNDEAVFMISQLAKLFRISLSQGRTVISVKDELQHAESYMNIQKVRYKNSFLYYLTWILLSVLLYGKAGFAANP